MICNKPVQPHKDTPPPSKIAQIDTLKRVMDGENEKEKPADSSQPPA
jgi:hypothetical protein